MNHDQQPGLLELAAGLTATALGWDRDLDRQSEEWNDSCRQDSWDDAEADALVDGLLKHVAEVAPSDLEPARCPELQAVLERALDEYGRRAGMTRLHKAASEYKEMAPSLFAVWETEREEAANCRRLLNTRGWLLLQSRTLDGETVLILRDETVVVPERWRSLVAYSLAELEQLRGINRERLRQQHIAKKHAIALQRS